MILFLSSVYFFPLFAILFSLHFLNSLYLDLCIISIFILQFSIFLLLLSMGLLGVFGRRGFMSSRTKLLVIFAHFFFFFSSLCPSSSLSIQSLDNMKLKRQKSYPAQDQVASPLTWHQIAAIIKSVFFKQEESSSSFSSLWGNEEETSDTNSSFSLRGKSAFVLPRSKARKQSSPPQMLLMFLLLVSMSEVPEISSRAGVTSLNYPAAESLLLLLMQKVSCCMYKQDHFQLSEIV